MERLNPDWIARLRAAADSGASIAIPPADRAAIVERWPVAQLDDLADLAADADVELGPDRLAFIVKLADLSRLGPEQEALVLALWRRCGWPHDGRIPPRASTGLLMAEDIEALTGLSKRTSRRGIAALFTAGIITVTLTGGLRSYTLHPERLGFTVEPEPVYRAWLRRAS